ncbi:MAG: AsmA-like C-terminal region-containing protein [Bacteroidales bacterium]|nr:AsmA-like C-terminal region-containing protein [Bacteroidales bacterium]
MAENSNNGKNVVRKSLKILAWFAGIWLFILLLIKIALSSSVIGHIIDRYSGDFIDGNLNWSDVSISVFSHFPRIGLTLEDFSITYPATRFDKSEQAGPKGQLMWMGCGKQADTLASFRSFSTGINLFALATGNINIPYMELDKPRVFIHNYADGKSNLDIILAGDNQSESSFSLDGISLGKVRIEGKPRIVYTDCADTVFAMVGLERLHFDGKLVSDKFSKSRLGMTVDSMFVAGRVSSDTLSMKLDKFTIHEHDRHMDVDARARAMVLTRAFGRINIPFDMKAGLSLPKDSVPAISLSHLDARLASVPLHGHADIRLHTGKTYVNGQMESINCEMDRLLKDLVSHFVPETEKIGTDAKMTVRADVDGYYIHNQGRYPSMNVSVDIPESSISHSDIRESLSLAINARASTDSEGRLGMHLDKAQVNTVGLKLNLIGQSQDIMSEDPLIDLDFDIDADLGRFTETFVPDSIGLKAEGKFAACIKGSFLLSQLDIYNFAQAKLEGNADLDGLHVEYQGDSILVDVSSMKMNLSPETKTLRSDAGKTISLLSIAGDVDSTHVRWGNSFVIDGRKVRFNVKNSTDFLSQNGQNKVNPLGVRLNAGFLSITDSESANISLDDTQNGFLLTPNKDDNGVPVLVVTSKNKRIHLKSSGNRAILTDASVKAKAAMKSVRRRPRVPARPDSLSRLRPDAVVVEDDFAEKDIDLKLDQTLAKYFREWDLNGDVNVRTGILMTPYFPLRNIVKGCYVKFDNNNISIDSLAVAAGESKIEAKGSLTGIRRALLGRKGTMNLDVTIASGRMNANELLKAYRIGSKYQATEAERMNEASNSEFLKMVTNEVESNPDSMALIVVPGNINARVETDFKNILFSNILIDSLQSQILLKDRCLRMTETRLFSDAGNASFDGFYSTRSKKDIRTGFSLNCEDITAGRILDIIPAADSLIPALKSFKGMLRCEIAATADIDTNMNVLTPSINGVMRISGKELSISDNDVYSNLARKLKFKDSHNGFIDKMTVEGIIKDNKLEVFPFVLDIDRYTLAMSGIQNLDMSFKYHISVLRSPLVFRVGINLSGDNFDNMKFRIGKAIYKNANVPVFSAVIDQTKFNLLQSIKGIFEKGVDAAINENASQKAFDNLKKETGYVNAAEQKMEALSKEEQQQLVEDNIIEQQELIENKQNE